MYLAVNLTYLRFFTMIFKTFFLLKGLIQESRNIEKKGIFLRLIFGKIYRRNL
jgi:hypothetical protein